MVNACYHYPFEKIFYFLINYLKKIYLKSGVHVKFHIYIFEKCKKNNINNYID